MSDDFHCDSSLLVKTGGAVLVARVSSRLSELYLASRDLVASVCHKFHNGQLQTLGVRMKRVALQVLENCGVFAIARTMSAKMGRILMYHNFSATGESAAGAVDVADLRWQLTYLRRHFDIVPLSQIFKQLRAGVPLDRLSVVLTIDDGRRNCYEVLFPILKEFDIPATFFVVTSFIRCEDWLWTDKVLWLSEHPSRPNELSGNEIEVMFESLNRLRPEIRNTLIAEIAAGMGVSIPSEPPAKYAPCTWSELSEMAESGLVEIGSHTVTHPILASIGEDESWEELTVSRRQIEDALRRPVEFFCFPNGKSRDYRPSQLHQVRDAGYVGAVSANFGMVTSGANPFELPRLGVSSRSDSLAFRKSLDGAEYYQSRLQTSLRLPASPRKHDTFSGF